MPNNYFDEANSRWNIAAPQSTGATPFKPTGGVLRMLWPNGAPGNSLALTVTPAETDTATGATIEGTVGDDDATVTVKCNGQTVEAVVTTGTWSVTLAIISTAEDYVIEVIAENGITIGRASAYLTVSEPE